jgi:hypothetical protein
LLCMGTYPQSFSFVAQDRFSADSGINAPRNNGDAYDFMLFFQGWT